MKNAKILLVDDCKSALSGMKRCLCNWSERIITAEDAQTALRLLKNNSVAIIISDYKLPDLNGIDLLERSKALSPNSRRVLLTGFPDLYAAVNAVNRGEVYRFLTKPYNALELKEIIADAFDPELSDTHLSAKKHNWELEELESSYPGIASVVKTATGAIEISNSDSDLQTLLNELETSKK